MPPTRMLDTPSVMLTGIEGAVVRQPEYLPATQSQVGASVFVHTTREGALPLPPVGSGRATGCASKGDVRTFTPSRGLSSLRRTHWEFQTRSRGGCCVGGKAKLPGSTHPFRACTRGPRHADELHGILAREQRRHRTAAGIFSCSLADAASRWRSACGEQERARQSALP